MATPCSFTSNPFFNDIASVLTPVACASVGIKNPSAYCCFLDHPPNDPTTVTLNPPGKIQYQPSTVITMPLGIFDGSAARAATSSTWADIVDQGGPRPRDAACYAGNCLAKPNLANHLGNVTVIRQSDPTCQGPMLNREVVDADCPQGVSLAGGCDPASQDQGCTPCCTGLMPQQIGCRTVAGNSYGFYQCPQALPCEFPYTGYNNQCYLLNPVLMKNGIACQDSIALHDTALQHSYSDHGGSGDDGGNTWCWSVDSWADTAGGAVKPRILPGMWYCAGNNANLKADCNRSTAGCWCQNTSDVAISHTNSWHTNPNPYTDPGVPPYCPWPPTEESTCAAQGNGAFCTAGPVCE